MICNVSASTFTTRPTLRRVAAGGRVATSSILRSLAATLAVSGPQGYGGQARIPKALQYFDPTGRDVEERGVGRLPGNEFSKPLLGRAP